MVASGPAAGFKFHMCRQLVGLCPCRVRHRCLVPARLLADGLAGLVRIWRGDSDLLGT
jgi:hypothetical protein